MNLIKILSILYGGGTWATPTSYSSKKDLQQESELNSQHVDLVHRIGKLVTEMGFIGPTLVGSANTGSNYQDIDLVLEPWTRRAYELVKHIESEILSGNSDTIIPFINTVGLEEVVISKGDHGDRSELRVQATDIKTKAKLDIMINYET